MTDREAIDVLFNEWKGIDRNDGIHCDRKCESCDLVMDVWIIREAFNMAISALQAQEAKTQLSAEGTTSDLISRQDAIEAVSESLKRVFPEHRQIAEKCLNVLPSAQSEWNNHTVACMLAELFDDTCACNYNGIDEWLPSKCELLDACPNPVGVACWEQYLKHRTERRTDDGD